MTTRTETSFALNFTLADPESYASLRNPGTPTVPGLFFSQIGALQQIQDEPLKKFIEGDLLHLLSAISLPALSNGASCLGDTVADLSWLLRTLMPEAPCTEWVGITTGENVIRGAWAAIKAWKRFEQGYAIGDKGGMIESGIDVPRGAFQSAGGAFYLAYRGLMVASDIQNVNAAFNATTALGKAAFAIGTIGNIFFSLFYVAITAWSIYEYYETRKFAQGMDSCTTDEELLRFFERKSLAHPMAKLNKSTESVQKVKENYSHIALDAMSDLLYAQMELLAGEESPPSKEDIKKLIGGLFHLKGEDLKNSETYQKLIASMGLKPDQIAAYDFSFLELLGFKLEEMNHQSRKDAKLSRVGGGPKIKKALNRGLGARVDSRNELIKDAAIEELANLKAEVISENTKNKVIFGLLLAVGVLGIVSSIIGFFPVLAAVSGTVLIVITLLLCLGMLGTDGYFMYNGWGSGMPGRYDKLYIVILALMIVTILGVAIGSTLAFGLPVLPLIFTAVFAVVGLGLCGIAFDEVHYKEKKWIWEHPDLNLFYTKLEQSLSYDDEFLDEKVTSLFKKLPKTDRCSIRKKYMEMSGNLSFKTDKYRKLDTTYDFGGQYFSEQTNPRALNDEKEHLLLLRGMKKTLNFYWEKWAIEKTEESKRDALEIQALFEAVSKKNSEAIKAATINMADKSYYSRLKEDLWYVVKREESKKDLMRAIQNVTQEEQSVREAKHDAPSLSERFFSILKSA